MQVRIVSTPEISDDVTEYYASPWDIRDRRRLDECENEDEFYAPELPPQSSTPHGEPPTSAQEEEYAVLERNRRKRSNDGHKEEGSYDRLTMSQEKGGGKEVESKVDDDDNEDKDYSFVNNDRPEPDGCNQNAAYEDDDAFE